MLRHLGVTLTTAVAALVLVGVVGVGSAAAGVSGTFHDLRAKATAAGVAANRLQICVFCHTPHNAETPGSDTPLWNRDNPDPTTFAMYSSPTLDMAIAGQPQGVSLACLSCHDGVTAYDALISTPYGWPAPGSMANDMRAEFAIGEDTDGLANDHPISITYDPTADPAFNPASSGKVGTLPLYGSSANQVECATCHDVHNFTPNTPFLRVSKTDSVLCLTCHIK